MGQLITTPNGVVSIRFAGPDDAVIVRDLHWVEAPRGELSYFLKSNGSEKPERIKVRTPSICNWSSVINFAVGLKLADIPMVLSGMAPCFSCNDWLGVVNRPTGSQV